MSKELPVGRKYELMIRDEQFKNYLEKYRQWLKNSNNEDLTKQVEQLRKQVRDKWNARIHWPEPTIQALTDFWSLVCEPYTAVKDARMGGSVLIEKNGKITIASFQENSLIHCPPHKIPIIIDPTILTLHDARTVKDEVWEIVKTEIIKRKSAIKGNGIPADLDDFLPVDYIEKKKSIKGRDFAVPAEEPEELAPVFRLKPETFAKYLRWYDLKMAGLSFRLIALIEFHSKPSGREQKFQEHINRRNKPKIGLPVNGESAVRQGFNIVYRAINRESAPAQEEQVATSGKYNCPDHGRDCPKSCAYLDRWLADFEKKHKITSLREWLPRSSFEPFH